MNIEELTGKHGNLVNSIVSDLEINGYEKRDIFDIYHKYPNMCLLTNMFDRHRYEIIKEKIMDSKYGFSFEVLFSLSKNKTFNFPNEIKKVLRYISGSNKEHDFKEEDKSIFTRINKVCIESNSRLPSTQLWFLPIKNINDISINLKDLMKEDEILKEYRIMIVNSNNDEQPSDVKLEIKKQERICKKHQQKGLIILAGNMLSLGITLENCDIVMLLNNTLATDKIMQQMYRCMTEAKNKNYGFVVDLNISRVLNTCISYNVHNKTLTIEEKIKYLVENHLINIDVDYFMNKEIDACKLITKIMNIWKDDPINNFRLLLKNLDDNYENFDNETQRLINKSFSSSIQDRINLTIEMKDEKDKQELPSGQEINTEENDTNSKEDETEGQENIVSFSKDVLPSIIPLVCILTIKEDKNNFVDMLNIVQKNNELLEIFDDQSLIWWNSKDLLKIIKKIVSKYYNENSNIYNISIQSKMVLQSLIDKPKELLELINDCLKPKQIEKKKFGEVFTPMKLVNEMLDKLPEEVWTHEEYKWFDPATGMGNFPIAVYLRLFESLKDKIPNDKKRKRHIIENMLYMSELNKKNCYIVEQIFNIHKKYKLNLYNGDTLKLDTKKIFGFEKFDVVMGNPPYQMNDDLGNRKAKNHSLYVLFMEQGIKLLNASRYLLFITPSSWLSLSGNNKIFKTMNHDNTIMYINLEEAKKKYFPKIGSTFCWFLVKKEQIEHFETIIDCYYMKKLYHSKVCIKRLNFISLLITKETVGILERTILADNVKFNVKTNTSFHAGIKKNREFMKLEQDDVYKYKIIHTPNQTFYSSKKHKLQDTYKIFIPLTTYYEKMLIERAGMTQGCYFIECKDEEDANAKYKTLQTKMYRFINNICRWGNFNCPRILEKLPFSENNNDKKIYKQFNLTNDEIKLIEQIID